MFLGYFCGVFLGSFLQVFSAQCGRGGKELAAWAADLTFSVVTVEIDYFEVGGEKFGYSRKFRQLYILYFSIASTLACFAGFFFLSLGAVLNNNASTVSDYVNAIGAASGYVSFLLVIVAIFEKLTSTTVPRSTRGTEDLRLNL